MSSPSRLMAAGMPAAQASQIGLDSAWGLTATGTNAATALVLTGDFANFSTVASGTGTILPYAEGQPEQVIYNGGANALAVYPQATEYINGGSVGASFSVPAGKACVFYSGKNTAVSPAVGAWIGNLSA